MYQSTIKSNFWSAPNYFCLSIPTWFTEAGYIFREWSLVMTLAPKWLIVWGEGRSWSKSRRCRCRYWWALFLSVSLEELEYAVQCIIKLHSFSFLPGDHQEWEKQRTLWWIGFFPKFMSERRAFFALQSCLSLRVIKGRAENREGATAIVFDGQLSELDLGTYYRVFPANTPIKKFYSFCW